MTTFTHDRRSHQDSKIGCFSKLQASISGGKERVSRGEKAAIELFCSGTAVDPNRLSIMFQALAPYCGRICSWRQLDARDPDQRRGNASRKALSHPRLETRSKRFSREALGRHVVNQALPLLRCQTPAFMKANPVKRANCPTEQFFRFSKSASVSTKRLRIRG